MKFTKRVASLLTSGALMGVSLVGISAPSASADGGCLSTAVGVNNSSGVFQLKKTLPLKKGPYSACEDGLFALKGRKFYAWCYDRNAHGNMWYYGREQFDDDMGWVYIGNVTFLSGTLNPCPFS
ncbi:hypothetical protein [Streptomyces luteogriseus]|uniref:SH3 domain-containing protein n=1 Tax=Streptomyces luteogriseus TaxID=68233 RepID=A0A7W7DRZ9_9ACTN|nr:hypothetical protein [Streptomyces luteogriseus]MBB4715586.1 hypothetical protein [Streptomyces luteogriseus]